MADPAPELTVIIPAHNEAGEIDACLGAVLASNGPDRAEVLVIANGCTDDTAELARAWQSRFAERCWSLRVHDLEVGSKIAALNAGDQAANGKIRVYLDADVVIDADLLLQLMASLSSANPSYASGTLDIVQPKSAVTRAYRRIYSQVPFIAQGVPGCGVFALNTAGRARWSDWPDIISDDTFARLHFAPGERRKVPARYRWPLVEGWRALVRVRRRQNRGVDEIAARFPHLLANDDKPSLQLVQKLVMATRDPLGFAIYAGVALATRFGNSTSWERGR